MENKYEQSFSLLPQVDAEHQIHLSWYIKLIESRPERNLKREFGFHVHHVFPESMGGVNDSSNLIKLTYREHFIAHMILFYCNYESMISAFYMMNHDKRNYDVKINAKQYEHLLKELSYIRSNKLKNSKPIALGSVRTKEFKDNLSIKNKGENSPTYGRKHSEEELEKMREAWVTRDRNFNKGRKQSEEHKNKIAILKSKKIMDIITGKEYSSIKEASLITGITRNTISYHCNDKTKIKKWKFI